MRSTRRSTHHQPHHEPAACRGNDDVCPDTRRLPTRASYEAILPLPCRACGEVERRSMAGTSSCVHCLRQLSPRPCRGLEPNLHNQYARPAVRCNRVSTTPSIRSPPDLTACVRHRRNLSIARHPPRQLCRASEAADHMPENPYILRTAAPKFFPTAAGSRTRLFKLAQRSSILIHVGRRTRYSPNSPTKPEPMDLSNHSLRSDRPNAHRNLARTLSFGPKLSEERDLVITPSHATHLSSTKSSSSND